jgi:hypothetical protein
MRFRFLGLSLAGFAAAATAGTHEGLKIVTRETFPAGTNESTTHIASDRVRVESRMSSHVSGWGRTAQIIRSVVASWFR